MKYFSVENIMNMKKLYIILSLFFVSILYSIGENRVPVNHFFYLSNHEHAGGAPGIYGTGGSSTT